MNNGAVMTINMDDALIRALKEDVTSEDITTAAVMPAAKRGRIELICKEDGILCGIHVFKRVFELIDPTFSLNCSYEDGEPIRKGDVIAELEGDIRSLLTGERTALNYLQRMSGIATMTHAAVQQLDGYRARLLDTRKTTPGMRLFEKYAVKIGGGTNHRYNLSDGILLKDNHIDAAGGVKEAIEMARAYAPFVRKIEVEVESLEMLDEAIAAGADIIMLDNMSLEKMKEAVQRTKGRAELECSGNVTPERLQAIAETGVDYISCGALTHSAKILDFSLKHLTTIGD